MEYVSVLQMIKSVLVVLVVTFIFINMVYNIFNVFKLIFRHIVKRNSFLRLIVDVFYYVPDIAISMFVIILFIKEVL